MNATEQNAITNLEAELAMPRDARENFTLEALTLYQCPGGTLVTDRKDCFDASGKAILPELSIG